MVTVGEQWVAGHVVQILNDRSREIVVISGEEIRIERRETPQCFHRTGADVDDHDRTFPFAQCATGGGLDLRVDRGDNRAGGVPAIEQ